MANVTSLVRPGKNVPILWLISREHGIIFVFTPKLSILFIIRALPRRRYSSHFLSRKITTGNMCPSTMRNRQKLGTNERLFKWNKLISALSTSEGYRRCLPLNFLNFQQYLLADFRQLPPECSTLNRVRFQAGCVFSFSQKLPKQCHCRAPKPLVLDYKQVEVTFTEASAKQNLDRAPD